MKRWMWYGVLVLVSLAGAWGAVRVYRGAILAREAAERAEERTEFVRDSTQRIIDAAEKEIKAAQERITELTVEAVEIAEDLEESQADANSALDVVESALPDSLQHLARRLRAAHDAERLDWARTVANRDRTIVDLNWIIAQKDIQRDSDSLLIVALTDEAAKWKTAANASFKFNVGSTVVTAGATALITLGFVAITQ